MPLPREARDLVVFLGGTILGILGNMFAEYFIIWTYPEGVPEDAAMGGTFAMGLLILIYGIVVGYAIREKPIEH